MTATYCRNGLGSSPAAYAAARDGRLPLTRAIPFVVKFSRCSRKAARMALLSSHDGEWHHTSKYANPTNFYDYKSALRYLAYQRIERRLPDDWYPPELLFSISGCNERIAALDDHWKELADRMKVSLETLKNIYYEIYSD